MMRLDKNMMNHGVIWEVKLLTNVKLLGRDSKILVGCEKVSIFALAKSARPIRLSVRTQDFHS